MNNFWKQTIASVALAFGLAAQPADAQTVKTRVFDNCAEDALDKTPEAAGNEAGSAMSIAADDKGKLTLVNRNGTSLELSGDRTQVIARGPGARNAMNNFVDCAERNGQIFTIR